MDRKIKSYLFDIFTCIDEVESFFHGSELTLDSLLQDKRTLRAVERELEIIGEATKNLIKLSPSIAISNSKQIINARNLIAHEYGNISYEIILNIISQHFPILKKEVKTLLDNQ